MISWITIHAGWICVVFLSFIIVISLSLGRKQVAKLAAFGRKELIAISIIVLGSWLVRQFVIVHMHNVYLDEFSHMQLSQAILDTGEYGYVSIAGDPEAPVVSPAVWPPGFHTFLAVAYLVAGRQESTAYALNAILGALGILTAWFYVRMLSFSASTSLLSATVIGLWPIHLRLSGGASLEPGAMAMALLAASLSLAFLRTQSRALFWASGAAIGLAGMFRLESVAAATMVPVILTFLERRKCTRPLRLSVGQLLGIGILLLPVILFALVGYEVYHDFRSRIDSIPYWESLSFWFGGGLMPYSYTALILIGSIFLAKHRMSLLIACSLTILGMVLVYSLYTRVDASLSDLQRYQLLCAPGFIGFVAASFQWAENSNNRFFPSRYIIALFVFLGLIPNLPGAQHPFQAEHEQRYRFIISCSSVLPKDAIYFAAVPPLLSTTLGVKCYPLHLLIKDIQYPNNDSGKAMIYFRDVCSSTPDPLDKEIFRRFSLRLISSNSNSLGPIGFYEILGPFNQAD